LTIGLDSYGYHFQTNCRRFCILSWSVLFTS